MKYFKIINQFPDYIVFRDGTIMRIRDLHTPAFYLNPKQNNLRVDLIRDGKRYNKIVKRIVAKSFMQNPENYRNILHTDGDVANVHCKNLQYTNKQRYGRGNGGIRGEAKGPQAKLTNEKVAYILISNLPVTKLAKILEVSYPLVSQIKSGKKWQHISSLSRDELFALAKNIELTQEERDAISVEVSRNKFTREGVRKIIRAKDADRKKVPVKIDAKTTIFVTAEKVKEVKRKYNLV